MVEEKVYIEELPTGESLDELGKNLLSESGPVRYKRVQEPQKNKRNSQTVVYLANNKIVSDILRDEETFLLSHYDRAFDAHSFMLTSDDDEYHTRQNILRLALCHDEHRAKHTDLNMNEIAERVAERVASSLLERKASRKRFDLVREFSFMVGYNASVEAFGVRGPNRSPLVAHFLRFLRLLATRRFFFLTRETREMQNMLCATQVMVGQLFGNFENRSGLLKSLGLQGAKHMSRAIKEGRARDLKIQAGNLITLLENTRLQAQKDHGIGDVEFDRNVDGILFEFVGTMVLLVGAAFARMVAVMKQQGLSFQEVASQLEKPDENFGVINELMRLDSPTVSLMRQVAKDTELHGVKLRKGEFVFLLIPDANLDSTAFACPHEYHPTRTDQLNNVHFGPWDGPHGCRAPNWTCEIIRQLFLKTRNFPNLRFVEGGAGEPKVFQNNIDSWLVEYD